MNPFDLRGPEFLIFYVVYSAVMIGSVILVRRAFEAGGEPKIDLSDPYLIAYLRGGKDEVLRIALVSLIDRGLLIYDGTKIEAASHADRGSVRREIERALLDRFAKPREATGIFQDYSLETFCEQYRQTLEGNRLLPDRWVKQMRRALTIALVLMLGGVAATRVVIALSRGRTNVIFLVGLTIAGIVIAVKLLSPRLTALGSAMLSDIQTLYHGLKERAASIRPGGASAEAVMLMAAFGVAALTSNAFAYARTLFLQPRASSTWWSSRSWSNGSSCSSSCGSSCGGGCGGGGCGGCGS